MEKSTKENLEKIGLEIAKETVRSFSKTKNIKKALYTGTIAGTGAGVSILSQHIGLDIEYNLALSFSTMVVTGVIKSITNWLKNRN